MATSQTMLAPVRAALFALLLIAPGLLLAARILHPAAPTPVRFALDGEGAVERVELVQHGEDRWLDASVADAGGWRLVSSTRVPGADGRKWSVGAEVVAPGQVRLHVRDGRGRHTSWRPDGLAFVPVADNGS